jgi:hypothetical protein
MISGYSRWDQGNSNVQNESLRACYMGIPNNVVKSKNDGFKYFLEIEVIFFASIYLLRRREFPT